MVRAFFEGKADFDRDHQTTVIDFWEFFNAYVRDEGFASGPSNP
jgi:hypothetical protein